MKTTDNSTTDELLRFIENSPTQFHAADNVRKILLENDFEELRENDSWKLEKGGRYFLVRNESAVIAFKVPQNPIGCFMIGASHSDSPCFKIKENPEMICEQGAYVKLNAEGYGGMLMAPWFDRPLSVAGRICLWKGNRLETKLVNIDRDLMMIPSLAIHMDRSANEGHPINVQTEMLPVLGSGISKGGFMELVAENAEVSAEEIASADLFLYCRSSGSVWGANKEFFSAPRLDDLQCAYTVLQGFVAAPQTDSSVPVYALFDNEEVGSGTKQGACSDFLKNTLQRIVSGTGGDSSDYGRITANSFMVSADNAHAVHPNHGDKACPTNRPVMNGGIVVKHNAAQKYTTDAVSAAVFKAVCRKAGVPVQDYFNRSDIPGGSTLGHLSNAQVSLNTVDIGLAQLAMHSPYETAGVEDTERMIKAMKVFFGSTFASCGGGNWELC
ncbi:MAG: M18 family aminopeptidase [Treponemataceae bacterium]|nr:M18 family aminopeptidase [Treponemataceae bacterium]